MKNNNKSKKNNFSTAKKDNKTDSTGCKVIQSSPKYEIFNVTKSNESHLKRETANCISMMFPFHIKASQTKKAIKKLNRLSNATPGISPYLTTNMRFYNYVIKNYGANEPARQSISEFIYITFEKHEELFKNSSKIGDILLKYNWRSDKKSPNIYRQEDNRSIGLSPNDIRLFISSSGVGIISLFFNIEADTEFEEYRFQLFFKEFKSIAKDRYIKDYISNIVKNYADVEISFFEENKFDDTNPLEKRTHVRAIFFCNLTCKKTPSLPLIPLWVTGHNTFSALSQQDYNHLFKNRSSLSEGNTVDTTSEGCMILSSFDATKKGIRSYYECHAQSFCQHIFVSYVIAQHQYFCLHNITQQSANIVDKKHFTADTLYKSENYIKSFALFRKNYSFNHISSVTKFQDAYEAMIKNLNIESFVKETNYTLEPVQLLAEKNIERKKAGILAILSTLTLLNTLISIFTVTLGEEQKLSAVCYAIIPTAVLMLILTLFVIPNRIQRTIVSTKNTVFSALKNICNKIRKI